MEAIEAEAEKIEALKARKREQVAEDRERNDSGHILHLVFASRKALRDHLTACGMDADQHYVDAERYLANVQQDDELDDLPFGDG